MLLRERFLHSVIPHEPEHLVQAFTNYWFFNQLPVFLIGFVTFFALRDIRLPKTLVWLGLLLSVAMIVLLPFVGFPGPQNVKYALCFGVIAYCLGRGNWRVSCKRTNSHIG